MITVRPGDDLQVDLEIRADGTTTFGRARVVPARPHCVACSRAASWRVAVLLFAPLDRRETEPRRHALALEFCSACAERAEIARVVPRSLFDSLASEDGSRGESRPRYDLARLVFERLPRA